MRPHHAWLLICILFVFGSCRHIEKSDPTEVAQAYYSILTAGDLSTSYEILSDPWETVELPSNYTESWNSEKFKHWLAWDSVFDPSYGVEMNAVTDSTVTYQVTKMDSRIAFLHDTPMVYNEKLFITDGKISRIERDYEQFDVERFVMRRDKLVSWVTENYPELGAFIIDQSESGGQRYLQAISLYRAAHDQ